MSNLPCQFRSESPADDAAICTIQADAFGPGRFARSAFRVREGIAHDADLSFVALKDDEVIASVRLTPVRIGTCDAQLLGPLAVQPAHKNKGIGRMLLRMALDAARDKGETLVLLVGDAPYYAPFGFRVAPMGSIFFPGPVDPARVLVAELVGGAAQGVHGAVRGRGLAGE
ncbi:N-acetyltransferase [Breoghania sp. L-A4]|nr:N-acetyltransferase [Breoghania sp. L-A4]